MQTDLIDTDTGLPILLANRQLYIERALKKNKEEHQKLYGERIKLGTDIREWFSRNPQLVK